MADVTVRRAHPTDLREIAVLAANLVRMHHSVDPDRFFLPDDVEHGYEYWLGRELGRKGASVVVAERALHVIGYAYGTLEGRDWNALLDKHGSIHDIYVAEDARGIGVGRKLMQGIISELKLLGATRFVLSTMVSNTAAQELFRSCGFRPTMLEMTLSTTDLP